jgi:hypothetical protein
LGELARAAGYSTGDLKVIVHAALPKHVGVKLDDDLVGHMCTVVEILALTGYPPDILESIMQAYHRKYGTEWRVSFWQQVLRLAARNEEKRSYERGAKR